MIELSDRQIEEISGCVGVDDLPGDLPEVAEYIGVYKALLIGYHMGAGRIYLKRWSDDRSSWSDNIKRLVDIIGVDDAKIIVSNFDGAHIDIPKCDRFWKAWIHNIICKSGGRQIDLARMYGYSDRHIRRIIKNKDRINQSQPDLFLDL